MGFRCGYQDNITVYYSPDEWLIISSDGDESNAYTGGYAVSYAIRAIDVTSAGIYNFAYNWRNQGATSFFGGASDYVDIFLAQEISGLAPDTDPTDVDYNTSIPAGWIRLGSNYLYNHAEWQSVADEVQIPSAGRWYIVVMWSATSVFSFAPELGAAIDNLSIFAAECAAPTGLTYTTLTDSSASIAWVNDPSVSGWLYSLDGVDYLTTIENHVVFTGLTRVRVASGSSVGVRKLLLR